MIDIKADLTRFPEANPELLGLKRDTSIPQELHIGDLSGNSLLLLWVLLTSGKARLDAKSYSDFVELYQNINKNNTTALVSAPGGKPGQERKMVDLKKIIPLTPDEQELFNQILSKLVYTNVPIIFILYGDEPVDRLGSDLFIIGFMYHMAINNVQFGSLASNHLQFFVNNFLSSGNEDLDILRFNGQGVSYLHFIKTIGDDPERQQQIRKQVCTIFLERLKLIRYTLDADKTKITLGAHAIYDLQSLLDVANHYEVEIPEVFNTNAELGEFIDAINFAFYETYVSKFFTYTEDEEVPEIDLDDLNYDDASNPVSRFFWLKDYSKVNRPTPACFAKLNCTLYHGHIDAEKNPSMPNRFSLNIHPYQPDNNFNFQVVVTTPLVHAEPKKHVSSLLRFFKKLNSISEQNNNSGQATPNSGRPSSSNSPNSHFYNN